MAGDLNIELGLLCACDEESDKLGDSYGPHCWQRFEADRGGLEKMMWWDVMMEFDCKVTSTWPSCEERKEMAYTPKQWGPKGKISQLN